jgi:hypothetical protein
MPLSAPMSVTEVGRETVTGSEPDAFLRALRVLMGEVSKPRPFDQEKSDPRSPPGLCNCPECPGPPVL